MVAAVDATNYVTQLASRRSARNSICQSGSRFTSRGVRCVTACSRSPINKRRTNDENRRHDCRSRYQRAASIARLVKNAHRANVKYRRCITALPRRFAVCHERDWKVDRSNRSTNLARRTACVRKYRVFAIPLRHISSNMNWNSILFEFDPI